ncbi:MAG: cyclic-di-AMP receptor [Clostridia bacterium]|nr:cyclic-di-AMP receptor [Clostridia bacterium]
MKLIMAIVNNDDGPMITAQLNKKGVYTTKIASTGGFLSAGNMTFISGVEDEMVDEVIEIIKAYSRKRTQPVPNIDVSGGHFASGTVSPAEVLVGGGTIFVLNVEGFTRV